MGPSLRLSAYELSQAIGPASILSHKRLKRELGEHSSDLDLRIYLKKSVSTVVHLRPEIREEANTGGPLNMILLHV